MKETHGISLHRRLSRIWVSVASLTSAMMKSPRDLPYRGIAHGYYLPLKLFEHWLF